jgi:hypothetical protein
MRINESVFRKILREEARRVLNEATTGDATAAAPAGATASPVGGARAVAGPPTAAASGDLAAATAQHDTAYKAADAESNRLIASIDSKGPAARPLMTSLGLPVKAGIGKLKDSKSPEAATMQTAISLASGRGTAGGPGANLILFATLAKGKAYSDWHVAVRDLGYTEALSAADANQDDPSKITSGSPGLKALISLATEMGNPFSSAVIKLLGTSQAVKTAAGSMAPKAAPAGAPAPGTARAAAGPPKDWPGYISKVRNGAAVQQAWSDFAISTANTQGYSGGFGSFVKYYNALIKQMNVKFISPEKMVEQLRKLIADGGLTPVTIAPDTTVPSLGGGALQGAEANAAAQAAANAASMQSLRTPSR